MLSFKNHRNDLSCCEDISDHKPIAGTQYGSNPGGIHVSPSGEKHYVKFYSNHEQAKAEVATAKVYEHLGVSTLQPKLVNYRGHMGVASKWRDDLKPIHPKEYENPSEHMKGELAKQHVAGVLTKNWDVVGNEFDNLHKAPDGKIVNVDLGGALHFRAMGGHKEYSPDISERHSYHDPKVNQFSAHAFKSLTNDHLHTAFHGMGDRSDAHVTGIFAASGLKNPQHYADTFAKRRGLLKHDLSGAG